MSEKETGGPAFSVQGMNLPNGEFLWPETGMTLRDYFAAKSIDMATLAEKYSPTGNRGEPTYRGIARRSYFMADAMLEARKS